MATKQQSTPRAKRPAGTRAPSSGQKRTTTTTTRARAPRRAPAPPPPTLSERFFEGLAMALDGHGHDVAGLGCIALGIVGGLGVYAGSAGPFGSAAAALLGAVFGVTRYLAPVALVAGGVLLVRGPRVADRRDPFDDVVPDEDEDAYGDRVALKRGIGAVLVSLAVTGLIHLAVDPPTIEAAGMDAYRDAGGYIGAAAGGGLEGIIGVPAAAVVLVLALAFAVTLLLALPFREILPRLRTLLSPAVDGGSRSLSKLFQVGEADGTGGEGDVPLFDYASDPTDPLAKKSRAPRKKPAAPAEPVIQMPEHPTEVQQLSIQLDQQRPGSPWKLPALSLLARSKAQAPDEEAIRGRGRQLEAALAEHGVTTRLSGMVVGPTVTRYELELGVGVKVNQVVNLSKDIAYAMASPDVRIIAPIPGKQAIGVEVPNQKRQLVALGDILCSPEAQRSSSPLNVAVGRDIEGKAVTVDLAKMPHILIAGQTGAGKSSCINSIMTSVLMRATPDDVRLILVDPKRVELTQYNRVPHLLTQVVTNPKKAANALAWAVAEMERRYELLEEVGCRDIGGYNAAFDRGELKAQLGEDREFVRLPLILIVVDELADLMMVAARDVEESINRIAAKARAVGLHLVIATQRPSVNVITGVIKANIPARFAFSVASATDSKVIMNHGGAERLVGKGDMLFLDPAAPSAERIQGCFVDEKEVQAVVGVWRGQTSEVQYVEEVVARLNGG